MPEGARPGHTATSIAEAYALGPGPWTRTPVTRGALGRIWKLSLRERLLVGREGAPLRL
ncbi:hypothetical protein GCM10010383_38760 [Streptomyces lomondensis]|uniref:Uncharacterized protein n=1 Tax=Streptomyces lomondensis TaxID=68229 RepID=A0ABQ2X8L0_9ACTN|nr:hypothetical protein GCM10010383_38760 [Streptomyces lomondensis]